MSTADRYSAAGVDLDAANEAKERIAAAIASTRTELARGAIGAFGGMVRVPDGVAGPTLVMSADGVGTKVLVAIMAGKHGTVGEDLVNHSVNDILVHGARPLAFLDYLAVADLSSATISEIVGGVARGCRAHQMNLVGGETAQLPELYHSGHYDLAGTIVGIVAETEALHGDRAVPGDVLIGYASNGLHTNGYTLARRIVFDELGLDTDSMVDELGTTVGAALLEVHRSYWKVIAPSIGEIHALAHVTGGGIEGNLTRSLGHECGAVVERTSWTVPVLFRFLEQGGHVDRDEMYRVFNMGVGMIAVVAPQAVDSVRRNAEAGGVQTWVIGEVVRAEGVTLR